MSDEQAGSLNKACSDYRSSHSIAVSAEVGDLVSHGKTLLRLANACGLS
jgi:hypothetical protein